MAATVNKKIYDVCVIGSGAGGAPLAYELASRGLNVVILERGKQYTPKDFTVDEFMMCRKDMLSPGLNEGAREIKYGDNEPIRCNHLWTGTCAGGGTVRMSGFCLPMKSGDFKPLTNNGRFKNSTYTDWPITLDDLSPYYEKVEKEIGVSGDANTTPDRLQNNAFPFPPLKTHPFSKLIDRACQELGYHPFPIPRLVLSKEWNERKECGYCGFCGSYGCGRRAKGSVLVTYLKKAGELSNADLLPEHYVYKLKTDGNRIVSACYFNPEKGTGEVKADTYVLACSAIETARLLLNSWTSGHSNGLANSSGQVGKNLAFQFPSEVDGYFLASLLPSNHLAETPFVDRALQDLYCLKNQGLQYPKGGTVIFLLPHPNPIQKAISLSYDEKGNRVYGFALKQKMADYFQYTHLISDTFIEFITNPQTFITISKRYKDSWGIAAAKVSIVPHEENIKTMRFMAQKIAEIYKIMGAQKAIFNSNPFTAGECQQGTCRFGNDPKISVLNSDCRCHDVKNLYITDSSFMPSGISVPPVFTIMANSLRVADRLYRS